MDGSPSDGLDSAVSTQHAHAGHDVDFAGDKPCGDDPGQSKSLKWGCLSFAPSAEFSDAKVLNVVTRSIVVTQSRFTSLVRRLQELVLVASFG